ncbi:MAG: MerR family transcriptional regulator [Oscillospiraceae bacterium]|nr:MerR family transcriptional regulator [Oscillospiraceae bacterium]
MMGTFEIADLFGITTEALRKYEAKGIIQPCRDENGYRKYSSWELTKIIRARQLRKEGISLNDIVAEMEGEDFMRQLRDMEDLRRKLTEEIAYREKLICWLDSQREELLAVEELGEGCKIELQSRRYCCVYMVGDTLVNKEGQEWEHLKEWIQALPFARVCYMGKGAYESMLSCLCLGEEELEQYGLWHLTPDLILSEQSYVVCNAVAEHSQSRDTSEECIAAARRRAKRLGVRLDGHVLLQMLWYTQREGIFQSHNKAMFPIKK